MTIKSTYESFLNEPSRSSIADEAALNYITTATQIVGAENIHEHLAQLQETTVKKNEQKILNVVEGYCSLSLEVQTALEFIGGGGPYVPDAEELDSIKGKTATLTIIHIVHFDKSDKIAQIRLIWDQAALLKQLSVIPSDSTLPIKDLSEQTQLVSQSASEAAKVAPEKPTPKKVTVKKSTVSSPSAPRTTRTTASRPAQRTPSDIFGRHPDSPSTPKKERSFRPDPRRYQHFDFTEGKPPQVLPRRNIRERPHFEFGEAPIPPPSPKKQPEHFEFGEAPPDAIPKHRMARPRNLDKHTAQWDFESFNTPEKPKPKVAPAHVRHFGFSEEDVDATTSMTPEKPKHVAKPRIDAEKHFEIRSEGTPGPLDKPRRTVGSYGSKARNLYDTNIIGDGTIEEDAQQGRAPQKPVNKGRKDIESHWNLEDITNGEPEKGGQDKGRKPQSHSRHNKELDHHFDVCDPVDPEAEQPKQPKSTSHARHNRELGHHFDVCDPVDPEAEKPKQPKSTTHARHNRELDHHFDVNDPVDPEAEKPKQPKSTSYARHNRELGHHFDVCDPVGPEAEKPKQPKSTSHARHNRELGHHFDVCDPVGPEAEKQPKSTSHARHNRELGHHFDVNDPIDPEAEKPKAPKATSYARHNRELGHHFDVCDPVDHEAEKPKQPKSASQARHHKELDHHWDITDDSPRAAQPKPTKPVSENRAKAVRNITSSFNLLSDDPKDAPGSAEARKPSNSTASRAAKDLYSSWDLPASGGDEPTPRKPSVSASTASRAARNMQSSWDIPRDETPRKPAPARQENKHSQAVRNMHSSAWDDFYGQSTPEKKQQEKAAAKKEAPPPARRLGAMRRDPLQPQWSLGDEGL